MHGEYDWMESAKEEWCYPDIESAQQPVLHCTEVLIPTFTSLPDLTEDETLLEAMEDTDRSCSNYSSTAWLLKHLYSAQTLNLSVKTD